VIEKDVVYTLPKLEIRWIGPEQRLVIEWAPDNQPLVRYIILGWTEGVSVERSSDGDTTPVPDKKLTDWMYYNNSGPVKRWKETIPNAVTTAVDIIPDSKIEILAFASNESTFADLLMSNPHLAWLSYCRFRDERWAISKYLVLISQKQHIILRELGFPATRSVAKILRSYSGCSLTKKNLLTLIELLRSDQTRKFFAHRTNLHPEKMAFILRFPHLVSAPFGSLFSALDDLKNIERLVWMYTCELHFEYMKDIENCGSKRSLISVIDRMRAELYFDYEDENGELLPLPLPPLPDGKLVKALRTQDELMEHGREGSLCLSSYRKEALEGLIAFYVVSVAPTPIIVSVKRLDSGELKLSEARAYSNARPSLSQLRYITDWFVDAVSVQDLVLGSKKASELVCVLMPNIEPSITV